MSKMFLHLQADLCRLSLWMLVLITLGDFVAKPSLAEICTCFDFGACPDSLRGPGPLDTSATVDIGDYRQVGDGTGIFYCMNYTTSFQWFKFVDNVKVPYPTEEDVHLSRVQCCDGNQTLIIKSAEMTDAGVYTFVASNGTASVKGNFTLHISCANAEPKLITKEQPIQRVYLGSSKTLKCAGNFGHCKNPEDAFVQWVWQDSSGTASWIETDSSSNWRLECNTQRSDCNLTILEVSKQEFEGKFMCKLETPRIGYRANYTIQLLPPVLAADTWTGELVGIVLGSVLALALVCSFIWWYHGDRIKFMCRRQPDRGQYKYDAVLVHGEDQKLLLHNVIRPQLTERGYSAMEETAISGRPEVLEQATAILESYCVILSYSSAELCEGHGHFLMNIAKLSHNHDSVVVIKPQDDKNSTRVNSPHNRVEEQDRCRMENGITDQAKEMESLQGQSGQQPTVNPETVWQHKAFKSVKILTWPQSLEELSENINNERNAALGSSRKMNKFWYSLFNHLPKPGKFKKNLQPTTRDVRESRSSGSSQRRLLNDGDNTRSSDYTTSYRQDDTAVTTPTAVVGYINESDRQQWSEDIPRPSSESGNDDVFLEQAELSIESLYPGSLQNEMLNPLVHAAVGTVNSTDRHTHSGVNSQHLLSDDQPESLQEVHLAVQDYRASAPSASHVIPIITNSPHPPPMAIPPSSQQRLVKIPEQSPIENDPLSPEISPEINSTQFGVTSENGNVSPTSPLSSVIKVASKEGQNLRTSPAFYISLAAVEEALQSPLPLSISEDSTESSLISSGKGDAKLSHGGKRNSKPSLMPDGKENTSTEQGGHFPNSATGTDDTAVDHYQNWPVSPQGIISAATERGGIVSHLTIPHQIVSQDSGYHSLSPPQGETSPPTFSTGHRFMVQQSEKSVEDTIEV